MALVRCHAPRAVSRHRAGGRDPPLHRRSRRGHSSSYQTNLRLPAPLADKIVDTELALMKSDGGRTVACRRWRLDRVRPSHRAGLADDELLWGLQCGIRACLEGPRAALSRARTPAARAPCRGPQPLLEAEPAVRGGSQIQGL